jgi:membrane-associated phospholipid phosphatase
LPQTDLDDPALASSGTKVEEADIATAEALGQHRHNPVVRALGALSEVADQAPAMTLCGALTVGGLIAGRPKLAEAGLRMLASVLVATAIKGVVKSAVTRARPHVLLDEGRYAFGTSEPEGGDWHSFPSGHTADAVAAARALAGVVPAATGAAYSAAAAIALIQVPRAKHYPLDVAAGLAVGILAEALVDATAEVVLRNVASRDGR